MANLPVPVPRTFTVSEVENAAFLNSIRDALNFMLKPPQARLHQASSQSLANNSNTLIAFDTTDTDTYGGHSNTTNNSRYTFSAAGVYLLAGGVSIATNTSGFRQISFRINGSNIYHKGQIAPSPSFETVMTSAMTLPFNVGDYVEFGCWQNSGGALSTVTADQSVWPWMDIYFISS